MTAVGIHAHPDFKLGRRPPKRHAALNVRDFLDVATVPAHPTTDDNLGTLPFGLYRNDAFGDCGPTSVANNVIMVTGGATVPTQDDVFDLYRRSGNPDFDPATGKDDNGVDMQTMCEALLAGGIGGRKPVAFATVDPHDQQALEAAIYTFDGVLFGVDLQTAQQGQTDAATPVWDYASPHSEWGGHAILSGRYVDGTGRVQVISWALHVDTTRMFRDRQLGEVWLVVWPEHLSRPGVNQTALAAAYKALTGKTLVVPTPAPPSPAPSPSAADVALWNGVKTWVSKPAHSGSTKPIVAELKRWARSQGLL